MRAAVGVVLLQQPPPAAAAFHSLVVGREQPASTGCEEMGVLQRLRKDLEPVCSPASRGAAVLTAGGAGLGDDRNSSSVVLLIARWEDEQPCKPAWCWL